MYVFPIEIFMKQLFFVKGHKVECFEVHLLKCEILRGASTQKLLLQPFWVRDPMVINSPLFSILKCTALFLHRINFDPMASWGGILYDFWNKPLMGDYLENITLILDLENIVSPSIIQFGEWRKLWRIACLGGFKGRVCLFELPYSGNDSKHYIYMHQI